MGEKKLQELKVGRPGPSQLSACDHPSHPRISGEIPGISRSSSDIPTGEVRLTRKRPNRVQLWKPPSGSRLRGMNTPISLDSRPGQMTGPSIAQTAKEAGHD